MEALLGCALQFYCQVVCISRRLLGIVPSSAHQPLRRFVPHPPVRVLPASSQDLGRQTDQCVAVVTLSSVAEDALTLFPSLHSRWAKFARPSGSHCLLLPVQNLLRSVLQEQIWHHLVTHVHSKIHCLLQLGSL